jgi:hypothetical protein
LVTGAAGGNLYQAAEELPPQLLALIRKLGGKPDSSLEAKGEVRTRLLQQAFKRSFEFSVASMPL